MLKDADQKKKKKPKQNQFFLAKGPVKEQPSKTENFEIITALLSQTAPKKCASSYHVNKG